MEDEIYEDTIVSDQRAGYAKASLEKAETNTYESLQVEPSKKPNRVSNRASSVRKYDVVAKVLGAVVCIGIGVAVGYAAAAWKNSIQTQGLYTISI